MESNREKNNIGKFKFLVGYHKLFRILGAPIIFKIDLTIKRWIIIGYKRNCNHTIKKDVSYYINVSCHIKEVNYKFWKKT